MPSNDAGLADQDLHFFREGTHTALAGRLGAVLQPGGQGARFAVWAPNASAVSVIGEWNGWQADAEPLTRREDGSGIWEGVAPAAQHGQTYKYRVVTAAGQALDKADPYAMASELPPATGSRLWSLDFEWTDQDWLAARAQRQAGDAPMSVYEVHPGSWRRDNGQFLGWRALAHALGEHVQAMGFTHVELMPVTEHPFYGSWGYQTTGYFAPTARYGTPQDLKYFIDHLHGLGIGVVLDWVPSHFPTDAHGLQAFDGTHLYEHADPRQGFHPEWNSSIFNYGRNEVRSFLLSSALFWLREYHFDALRVDAVASMLYLDYARKQGEWIPNRHGGRENLEAVDFLRTLNAAVARELPGALVVAEESTAWPGVSHPTEDGGLGFSMKWNMGWMHDTLDYFGLDPVYRKHHQGQLSFSLVYAFNERFVLPLSHDEVVYGKGSLLGRMPGDAWQKFANLRALFGFMWGHPGKKLLFMGGEFGQGREWAHEGELDWAQSREPWHAGVAKLVGDLNRLYRAEPALHRLDFAPEGFAWVAQDDSEASVFAFLRKGSDGEPPVLVVSNLTPVPRHGYRLGVPVSGLWRELLNSDARDYGGSGLGNQGGVLAEDVGAHGHAHSLALTLPPLSTLMFRPELDAHAD
ncbi:1,4-alpha-glucan branching protein GlgB [Pseudorhodoferax sp. Leaf274]|uniref:1,4-alpha-glucan branching protein GlgB n=1 Tax=Pseudorhodoferax sp. Leaf274 TaxID=1736318 RepID=UPI00070388BA|nr:1,4-alpha-glucan branching protein GlgB [Pseudorhodoferax sp. Leaf274]KQP36376.1 glycogen branching protein [Pseudorhodoferax sp. Leaf274]